MCDVTGRGGIHRNHSDFNVLRRAAVWSRLCDLTGVLRITTTASDKVVLRLEGRLVGPWVSELKKTVLGAVALSLPLEVDVWDLTYADLDGEKELSRLHRKGARFQGRSPYAEYLFQRLRIPLYSRHAEADDDEAR